MLGRRSTIDKLTNNLHQQLLNKITQISNLINKFNYRTKRALVNILGKAIKFITGNLDEDDLKNINENLDHLYKNQNSELIRINKLTSLANHLTKRYDEDFKILTQNIQNTENYLNSVREAEEIRIILQNEIYQSEILLSKLQMIERTISMSWTETPNLELMTANELIEIHKYLTKIYADQQLLPFDNVHLFKILQMTRLVVIGTNQAITFLLKIPILKPTLANYSQIYPLPNHQDIAIIPPKRFLVKINNINYWTDEDCQAVEPFAICLQEPSYENCTLQETEGCTTTKITNDYQISHLLKNRELLTISKEFSEVLEDCHGQINKRILKGTNILSSRCRIIIGTSTFDNTMPLFEISTYNISKLSLNYHRQSGLLLRHLENPTDLLREAEELQDHPIHLEPLMQFTHYTLTVVIVLILIIVSVLALKFRARLQDLLCKPRKIIFVKTSQKSNVNADVHTKTGEELGDAFP